MGAEVIAMVHYCPRCELRFRTDAEVAAHLAADHDVEVAQDWGRPRYRMDHDDLAPLYAEAATPSDVRRYLVVANQTLTGEALSRTVAECMRAGPASFHVLVPATHSDDYPARPRAMAGTVGRKEVGTDERGLAGARLRLRQGLAGLGGIGAQVTGEVGPADPFLAIGTVLARESFDEVVLSTLPTGLSRWLAADLPRRVERHYRITVRTVAGG